MSSGWVKLHRSAEDHPVLKNATRRGLFDRMLLRAARAPRKVGWRGRTVALGVGQLAVSVREFAEANELTHKEARLHLERLVREGMILIEPICGSPRGTEDGSDKGTKAAALGSLITICNFSRFQLSEDEVEAQMGTTLGTVPGTATGTAGAQQGHTEQEVGELETLTHPVEPETETPTESDGGKPPAYAFQGPGKMRLTQADFEAWQRAYRHLDLTAKLQQRADWYRETGEVPKGWFIATSNWLANENDKARKAAEAEEAAKPKPAPRRRTHADGYTDEEAQAIYGPRWRELLAKEAPQWTHQRLN